MFLRLGSLVTLLALLASMNLHLAAVQAVGWMTMVPDYHQQTGSLREAVRMTWSGDNPCPLCSTVERELDRQGETSATFYLGFAPGVLLLIPEAGDLHIQAPQVDHNWAAVGPDRLNRRVYTPPAPPPRVV